MNDYQAIEAINAVLEQYIAGDLTEWEVVYQISHISGQNEEEHEAAA